MPDLVVRADSRIPEGEQPFVVGRHGRERAAVDLQDPAVAEAASALLARLKGRKHLVIGNNDPPAVAALPGWASAAHYAELEVDGAGVVLCHYAFRTWRNANRGWANLHGHSHGRLRPPLPRQADVGVDAQDFRPVTLAQALGARRRRREPA